jgi:transposase
MEGTAMMGKPAGSQSRLFYIGLNMDERVPADHPLRRVAEVIDFRFVRARVAHLYGSNGNPSVDPTLLLKLMFLAFYERVRSERELMRQLLLRLDWLWFCGLDLDADIPDHSVLSKARRRWGLEVFEAVFAHVLEQCVGAGLVEGKTVYADSTQLKANASVESRVPRELWRQLEAGTQQPGGHDDPGSGPPARTPPPVEDTQARELPPPPQGKFNTGSVSRTDPDAATMKRRGRGVMLGYADHCLVDGRRGIVIATIAAPGDYDDGAMLVPLLEKRRSYLGDEPVNAVGDSLYGTADNIEQLRARGIRPYLKPRTGRRGLGAWLSRMPAECDPMVTLRLMRRRLHTSEGRFAEAHARHEHRRCRWRRRWRVQVQCYLVATVQNIKKLVRWSGRKARGAVAALKTRGADPLTRPDIDRIAISDARLPTIAR